MILSDRDHIRVSCEACRHKERLMARLGEPGHERGGVFYCICESCEVCLRVEIPALSAPPPATVMPWIARLWQR